MTWDDDAGRRPVGQWRAVGRMPPRNRGHGNDDEPETGTPSRPRDGGTGRQFGSAREEEDFAAEVLRAGRSTADGGSGGRLVHAVPGDLLTLGTGPPAGTPSGRRTRVDLEQDAEVRRSLELENSAATLLAGRGFLVQQNPAKAEVAQARLATGDVGDPRKDPDYLIEGRVFDCYAPIKPDKAVRGIWTQARIKIENGQAQRVVVNLEDWRGDMSALRKQFAEWPVPGLKEVKALTRDGDIVQIDLPPYRPMEVYPWLSNTP